MKVFYLNDEKHDVSVKVMDDTWDHSYKDSTDNAKNYSHLKPGQGKVYHLVCPEGSALFVKKWEKLVMLSYVDGAGLCQLEEELPSSGAV